MIVDVVMLADDVDYTCAVTWRELPCVELPAPPGECRPNKLGTAMFATIMVELSYNYSYT